VFFAAQLRDIEILVQQQAEDLAKEGKEDATLSDIQKILYSTEVRHTSFSSLDSLTICDTAGGLRGTGKRSGWGGRGGDILGWGFFLAHVYLRVTVSIIPVVPAVALSGLS